jgi:hypothetical protein
VRISARGWPQANRAAAQSVLDGGEHGVTLKRGGLVLPGTRGFGLSQKLRPRLLEKPNCLFVGHKQNTLPLFF